MKRSHTLLMLPALALAGSVLLASATFLASAAPAAQSAMLDEDPPIVDDFNRANETPLSDDGAWSNLSAHGLSVVSNQLACTQYSTCDAWRNDVLYGLDQEAWATIAVKPGNTNYARLYVRLQKPTAFDGYAVRFRNNTGTDQVFIERITGGAATTLHTINLEFAQGDKLKVRAVGSAIEAWRYSGGGWAMIGQAPDSTYLGVGYVGVASQVNGGRLDDFAAATLREPFPDTSIPLDDFNRPDENPLSHMGAWSGLSTNALRVISSQLACTVYSTCDAWRSDALYGVDQEAWATITAKPGNTNYFRLFARLQKPTAFNGYAVRFRTNSGTDQVFIERITSGAVTTLQTFNQEFLLGDKLRIRAIGSAIEAWRRDNNTASWTKLGQATDSTYIAAGRIGVSSQVNGGRLDDFGGGSAGAPPDSADLSLAQVGWPYESVGEMTYYRLDIANAGPNPATSTQLTVATPTEVTVMSARVVGGPSCEALNPIVCDLGTMQAGTSASVAIDIRHESEGNFSNLAQVTSSTSDAQTFNNGVDVRSVSLDLDQQLALDYRPGLLFDSGGSERWRPLDIGVMLAESFEGGTEHHQICDESSCSDITSESGFSSAYAHLDLHGSDGGESATSYNCAPPGLNDCDSGPQSVIYFEPTQDAARGYRYLDFWWFLRWNDSPLATGNHEGDWEGVTIALDPAAGIP